MRHRKDLYFVTTPSTIPWLCVIGCRLKRIPADNITRVWSLAAGPEHGTVVCEHEQALPYRHQSLTPADL